MKKLPTLLMVLVLVASLGACSGGKDNDKDKNTTGNSNTTMQTDTANSSSDVVTDGTTSAGTAAQWPAEFKAWDVPTINSAKVVTATNTSMEGGILVTGVNVVVNLKNVTKADFEAYKAALIAKGYLLGKDSLPEILEVLEKAVTGGRIKITLSYTADSTTIVANNSAAAAAKDTADGGKTQWPTTAKGIPEFTKGKYIETVAMGGEMYAITFSGVTDADVDWYRDKLKSEGFVSQENEDTEGYSKMTANSSYSVGFEKTGEKLQIYIAIGTF